jgi:hypothetical protein
MHTLYHFTITNFGDYTILGKTVWSFEVQVIIAVSPVMAPTMSDKLKMIVDNSSFWLSPYNGRP